MKSAEWPSSRIWNKCPLSIKSLRPGCPCFASRDRAVLLAGKKRQGKCLPAVWPWLTEPWHLTPTPSTPNPAGSPFYAWVFFNERATSGNLGRRQIRYSKVMFDEIPFNSTIGLGADILAWVHSSVLSWKRLSTITKVDRMLNFGQSAGSMPWPGSKEKWPSSKDKQKMPTRDLLAKCRWREREFYLPKIREWAPWKEVELLTSCAHVGYFD